MRTGSNDLLNANELVIARAGHFRGGGCVASESRNGAITDEIDPFESAVPTRIPGWVKSLKR